MNRNPFHSTQGYGWPEEEEPEWEPPGRVRKTPWGLLIAGLLAAMLIWESVNRAPDGTGRFALLVEDNVARAYGSTDENSYQDVLGVLDRNPQVDVVELRNVPGTKAMSVNTEIARLFRERGIATHIPNTGYAASGGVHLFLGGVERTAECGARLGVHSWQDGDGNSPESLGYDPAEGFMQAFHLDMGASEDFYPFTVEAAPHESIHILTADEMERFGLLTDGECERVGLLDMFRR